MFYNGWNHNNNDFILFGFVIFMQFLIIDMDNREYLDMCLLFVYCYYRLLYNCVHDYKFPKMYLVLGFLTLNVLL